MKLIRCSIAVASLGLASCGDGQAGSEYRGEPLMAMTGVVTSTAFALNEGLVPALLLRESPFDRAVTGPYSDTKHYVQGEVEGTFPSSFTLRVYDAPPAATTDALFEGEPAFTLGFLTAVSPQHPAWLRTTEHEEPFEGGSTQRDEVCSATQCLSGYRSECSEGEHAPNEEWPCGNRFPEGYPWTSYGYARDHLVLYVAGPVAAGSVISQLYAGGTALAAGYYVVVRDNAALASGAACMNRAEQLALEALNLANGTQWTSDQARANQREWNKQVMLASVAENCPKGLAVVRDTASAPVQLDLIEQPMMF